MGAATGAGVDPIKVYDARWDVSAFDDGAVGRLFEATCMYARLIDVDTVVFCRDARLGCPRVLELGVGVAMRMGFRVFVNTGAVSTPQGYFTMLKVTGEHPKSMGLMITASHNPAQYIGVKFTVPTVAAIGEGCGPMGGLTKIRELYHSGGEAEARAGGTLEVVDFGSEYIEYSLAAAGVKAGELKGLSVVLDSFHGSAGPELYRVLRRAGAEVRALRLVPNGNFPTGSPNPTSQGKMEGAIALAKEVGADVVVGVDGDGDRIVFGDGTGILTAGFAFVPILRSCMGKAGRGGTGEKVLYDPKVSPLALAEWGKLGAVPVLFRNGHSQIKDYMSKVGALAAAEESGHYYHRLTLGGMTISGENSAVTILLFLGALKKDRGLMAGLWAKQREVFTTGEFNYQFRDDGVRDGAVAGLVKWCAGMGARVTTATADGIDLQGTCVEKGVRLTPGEVGLEAGWFSGYFRVATNEPCVVRGYLSCGDAGLGRRLEGEARGMLASEFGGKVVE